LDLNIRRGFADSLGMDFAVGLRRDVDRGFGLAVKLFQIKPDAAIEAEDFRSDRLARRIADANAREPELVLQRAIHKKIPERIKQANAERYFLAVENLLAPAVGQRDEVVEYFALERARVRHAHHGERQKVLVDPRRREGIGGADLAAILQHGLRRLRTIDAIACGIGLHVRENVIADPGERQISDHLLFLIKAVERIRVARRDNRILEREHHALGAAGGSRGVKDDAEIGALAGSDAGLPLRAAGGFARKLFSPDRLDVRERRQPTVVIILQPAWL